MPSAVASRTGDLIAVEPLWLSDYLRICARLLAPQPLHVNYIRSW